MNTSLAIAILLGGFLLLVLLRFPIAYAVAIASIGCMLANGTNLALLCKMMVKGISSFSLMAVPFFITMGCLMGSGGISEKLIDLANSLVGWMTGGMAMVNIVASYFFGGISGSAAADHNHFRADFMGQVHMGGGQNRFMTMMLEIDKFFRETALVMIVDQCECGEHFLVLDPLLPGEFAADEIADEFGPVLIMIFPRQAIQFFQQRCVQRQAYTRNFGHDESLRVDIS